MTIAEILAGDARFTTLVDLVIRADLLASLEGEEALTVFAPTNEAFEILLSQRSEVAISDELLKNIILYHIAEGRVALENGKEVLMLNGDTVLLTVTEEEVKVNDANILEEICAENGVIYVIDAVLIPPYGKDTSPDETEDEIKEPVLEPEVDTEGALAPVDFRI